MGNAGSSDHRGPALRALLYALLIAAATVAVYWTVRGYAFTNFDDPEYVTRNAQVQQGLTWRGTGWAFTATPTGNWHPLTWLSHMLDVQLFGMNPGAAHGVNVGLHVVNALLLLVFLGQATGAWGRGAFIAAVFALHPLHVESVAWISERKDVLSTCFALLTLIAYTRYARRPRWSTYGLCLSFFTLGLMSKSMLVTLPCVLLLLDLWPLGRAGDMPLRLRSVAAALPRLIREKLPFFVLSLAVSVVTMVVQGHAESLRTFDQMPFGLRVCNAVNAYVMYVAETFYPYRLAVHYPYPPTGYPLTRVLAEASILVTASAAALWFGRRRPWLVTGWYWYLGMLVPVIGLVQVGTQAMADRYMYLPMCGLLIPLAWGAVDLGRYSRVVRLALPGLAVASCVALALVARVQVTAWKDSITLFEHAVRISPDSVTVQANLGGAWLERGDLDKALKHTRAALKLDPDESRAHNNLGVILLRRNRPGDAVEEFALAARIDPDSPSIQYNLGIALKAEGQLDAAVTHFAAAAQLQPDYADAHFELGGALLNLGRGAEAAVEYEAVVKLQPERASAWINLGVALCSAGRYVEAVPDFERGLQLNPSHVEGGYYLARCYASMGLKEAARGQLQRVLDLQPGYPKAVALLKELDVTPPGGPAQP